MEKFLFKKISVWVVLLLALLGVIMTIMFGWSVRHYYKAEKSRLGSWGPVVDNIAAIPSTLKEILKGVTSPLASSEERFKGEKGFKFNYQPGERADLGYLLLNRYDEDLRMSVAELVDLNTQEQLYQWRFDVDPMWKQSGLESNLIDLKSDRSTVRFRNAHSLLLEDGSIVVKDQNSPILKADICSNLTLLKDDDLYHHSIEMDSDNNMWVPKLIEPKTVALGTDRFNDNALTLIAPDGTILFEKSVVKIFEENGMGVMIYGETHTDDPIHLNDIEPVLSDGVYWKKGDVFLSLRNQSMIMLYRPSTNKVLWYQEGPWLHQHDVDILDDHTISVFDNNSRLDERKSNTGRVEDFNNVYVYDFATRTMSSPFKSAFAALEIRTPTEGRSQLIGNDEVFVEESDYGRLLQFDKMGDVVWQYVNRAADGKVYRLAWSRLIPRALGDKVRQIIKEEKCDVQ